MGAILNPFTGRLQVKTGGGSGGGGITTINGDSGSVTGSVVTFTAENAGSTVEFSGTGSTMDLNVTDSNSIAIS